MYWSGGVFSSLGSLGSLRASTCPSCPSVTLIWPPEQAWKQAPALTSGSRSGLEEGDHFRRVLYALSTASVDLIYQSALGQTEAWNQSLFCSCGEHSCFPTAPVVCLGPMHLPQPDHCPNLPSSVPDTVQCPFVLPTQGSVSPYESQSQRHRIPHFSWVPFSDAECRVSRFQHLTLCFFQALLSFLLRQAGPQRVGGK